MDINVRKLHNLQIFLKIETKICANSLENTLSKSMYIFYAPMSYGHMGRLTTMCDQN